MLCRAPGSKDQSVCCRSTEKLGLKGCAARSNGLNLREQTRRPANHPLLREVELGMRLPLLQPVENHRCRRVHGHCLAVGDLGICRDGAPGSRAG